MVASFEKGSLKCNRGCNTAHRITTTSSHQSLHGGLAARRHRPRRALVLVPPARDGEGDIVGETVAETVEDTGRDTARETQ
jgi:hypothetical protein